MLLDAFLNSVRLNDALVPSVVHKETCDTNSFRSDIILIGVLSDISECFFDLVHELVFRKRVQVLDNSVIVKDLQIVTRVDDRHEMVEVFIAAD